jgi:hypothetical protein
MTTVPVARRGERWLRATVFHHRTVLSESAVCALLSLSRRERPFASSPCARTFRSRLCATATVGTHPPPTHSTPSPNPPDNLTISTLHTTHTHSRHQINSPRAHVHRLFALTQEPQPQTSDHAHSPPTRPFHPPANSKRRLSASLGMPTLAEALTQLSSSDPPITLDLSSESIDAAGAVKLAKALKVSYGVVYT